MSFHFPLMPRLFMALRMEDRFPILDILDQTPAIPENCQWALFLRNHDELTLEMVTDEERDYMYRAYAHDPQARVNLGIRRRLAPLLGNDRRQIELLTALLFSLPGTPVLYYGDEIGMGDNIYLGDRNGVRTPMHWSGDRNAGFSRANPQKLYLPIIIDPEYHYEANNVEAQQANPHSLLWWTKRMIALRKRFRAFGRGGLTFLTPDNPKVLAFLRTYEKERILVVANLSRFVQCAALHLAEFQGLMPVEAVGRSEFPRIGKEPYLLTLGPYSFFWFALVEHRGADTAEVQTDVPHLALAGSARPAAEALAELLRGPGLRALDRLLPGHLRRRVWFRPRDRVIRMARVSEVVPLPQAEPACALTAVRVDYLNGDAEHYLLPLALAPESAARQVLDASPSTAVARVEGAFDGVLYDAHRDPGFAAALFALLADQRQLPSRHGTLAGLMQPEFGPLRRPDGPDAGAVSVYTGQAWLLQVYDDRATLKLFRRLSEGVHPEVEVGRTMLRAVPEPPVVPLAGALEYRPRGGEPVTLGVLHAAMPHHGDAFQGTCGALRLFFDQVLNTDPPTGLPLSAGTLVELSAQEPPPLAHDTIGALLVSAGLIGRRTGELHLALAAAEGKDFQPEPMTALYQRSMFQTMRNHTRQVFAELERRAPGMADEPRADARALLGRQAEVLQRFRSVVEHRLGGLRIRTHGDYHLGQLLNTGRDFVIAHFEGDRTRSPADRRLKRSALRDVSDLLASLRQAALIVLYGPEAGAEGTNGGVRREDRVRLLPWARFWYGWVGAAVLRGYFAAAEPGGFLPPVAADRALLCDVLLLEKTVLELGEALADRPNWVRLRVNMLRQLLGPEA
jgi:maltose alpha-D-glucosyltransferase/alpha-amylase